MTREFERPFLDPEYIRRTFRFLVACTGNAGRAEELLQRVSVNLLRTATILRSGPELQSYMLAAARNEVLKEQRAGLLRRETPLREEHLLFPARAASAAAEAETREEALRLQRAILALDLELREVLVLHAQEGMTFAAIAELTGVPVSTLGNRYQAALGKLKETLHER